MLLQFYHLDIQVGLVIIPNVISYLNTLHLFCFMTNKKNNLFNFYHVRTFFFFCLIFNSHFPFYQNILSCLYFVISNLLFSKFLESLNITIANFSSKQICKIFFSITHNLLKYAPFEQYNHITFESHMYLERVVLLLYLAVSFLQLQYVCIIA